jgi:hypothetical protein
MKKRRRRAVRLVGKSYQPANPLDRASAAAKKISEMIRGRKKGKRITSAMAREMHKLQSALGEIHVGPGQEDRMLGMMEGLFTAGGWPALEKYLNCHPHARQIWGRMQVEVLIREISRNVPTRQDKTSFSI